MAEQLSGSEPTSGEQRLAAVMSSKKPRKRSGSAPAEKGQVSGVQVSVTLPRDVIQAYEAICKETGVNRAHLMREALMMYAAILGSGQRVYQLPGIRRVA